MGKELYKVVNGKKTDTDLHDISREDDDQFMETINKIYRNDRLDYSKYKNNSLDEN